MLNQIVVRLATKRIMNKGLNPKTAQTYVIDDITNHDYCVVVKDKIPKVI